VNCIAFVVYWCDQINPEVPVPGQASFIFSFYRRCSCNSTTLAKHPQLSSFAIHLKGKTTAMAVYEFKHTSTIDVFYCPCVKLLLRFEHEVSEVIVLAH
jgi:hypothetical protein